LEVPVAASVSAAATPERFGEIVILDNVQFGIEGAGSP
jgi:hypothetical protein